MKPKIKKLKTHTLAEIEITYEYDGEKITRKIELKDNVFYGCEGFITSKELKYLKQIIEDYFY